MKTNIIKAENKKTEFSPRILGFDEPKLDVLDQNPADTEELSKNAIEIETLKQEIADLRQQLEALKIDHSDALIRCREESRIEAFSDFETNELQIQKIFEDGMKEATTKLEISLSQTEPLALAVAKSALKQIFGSQTNETDMVEKMIRHQFSTLQSASFLSYSVSQENFPTTESLRNLCEYLDVDSDVIVAEPALAAGQCVIQLNVGELELDFKQYSAEIEAFLDNLICEFEI